MTSSTFYARSNHSPTPGNRFKMIGSETNLTKNHAAKLLKPIVKQKLPYNFDLPQADIEQIRDENIKLKIEMHKMTMNYNTLKVDYLKVENDNKKAMMLLEDVLIKSGVKANELDEMVSYVQTKFSNNYNNSNLPEIHSTGKKQEEEEENELFEFNNNNKLYLTNENENKLKEAYISLHLKNQLYNMRRTIQILREELEEYKQKEKVGNYMKLQQEIHKKTSEISHLKDCFCKAKIELEQVEDEKSNYLNEISVLKTQLSKVRFQYDILNEKLIQSNSTTNNQTHTAFSSTSGSFNTKKGHDFSQLNQIHTKPKERKPIKVNHTQGQNTFSKEKEKEKDLAKVEKANNNLQQQLKQIETTKKNLEKQLQKQSLELNQEKEKLKEIESQIKKQKEINQKQRQDSEKEKEKLIQKYNLLKDEFNATEDQARELNSKLTDLKDDYVKLDFEHSKLKQKKEGESNKKLGEVKDVNNSVSNNEEAKQNEEILKNKIKTLEEKIESLEINIKELNETYNSK